MRKCKVSEKEIRRWQGRIPVVNIGSGKFESSTSTKGKAIIRNLICSSREQVAARKIDRRMRR